MSASRSIRAEYTSESRPRSRSSGATTRRAPRRALDDRAQGARDNVERLLSPPRQRGPALDPADEPIVNALEIELTELQRTHARFADRTVLEIRAAAFDFVRYRIRSMDAIKRSTTSKNDSSHLRKKDFFAFF